MIFTRQKHLIALMDALGGSMGARDFQKLLFLYCQEEEKLAEAPYDFVPYHFGGFSFTSYADKRKLVAMGLLEDDEGRWTLTEKGRLTANKIQREPERAKMGRFARQWAGLRGDDLVAETYRRHPWSAVRSKMVGRVLAGDAAALAAVEAKRPSAGRPGICTIGYEGHSLEAYMNQLLQNGVTLLCDVRRNPLSRNMASPRGRSQRVPRE